MTYFSCDSTLRELITQQLDGYVKVLLSDYLFILTEILGGAFKRQCHHLKWLI